MKNVLCAILLLTAPCLTSAQAHQGLWRPANGTKERKDLPATQVAHFREFTADEPALRATLAAAPLDYERAIIVDLPAPDGSFRTFRVWTTPVMEDGLAKNYPGIATYTAEAIGAVHITAKLDYTPAGFHALIFDEKGPYLIDPYGSKADGTYIAYYQKDVVPDAAAMICGVQPESEQEHSAGLSPAVNTRSTQRINGSTRKKYRLALACTGEYAVRVAGASPTKAAVLANLVSVLNKTNGIFERELAVTMQLVANDTTIIYLNGATDPYTNSNSYTMLTENQANLDSRIGTQNYDIGHVLSTSSPGLGQLGCVCRAGSKANGTTFYNGSNTHMILSHEMGHQLSANHTFNGSDGSCAGNGNAGTAVEPGSGSTIMSYGGLCATHNIQSFSDAYYNSRSLEEMTIFIGNVGTCAIMTPSTNGNAVLQPFAANYAIPYKTPFELTAPLAADATKDTLTYCWEERDLGAFGSSLAQTGIYGPLFRTFLPATSRTRVFPRIEALIGKAPLTGEKLPDTARTLAFRLIERDIYQGWGTFNYPDDSIKLTVINTKKPFTVTYPKGGEALAAGSRPTIRWDVVGTTAAPISCAGVDIYLSVDSGLTYPHLLRAATPNDGLESIQLPTMPTTTGARIKVKCSNNVFFNISGGNFTMYFGSMAAEEARLADAVKISPVPARDILTIEVPAVLGSLQMRIYNTLGQALWGGTVTGRTTLDVAGWPRGMYQAVLCNEAGIQISRKLIVE